MAFARKVEEVGIHEEAEKRKCHLPEEWIEEVTCQLLGEIQSKSFRQRLVQKLLWNMIELELLETAVSGLGNRITSVVAVV